MMMMLMVMLMVMLMMILMVMLMVMLMVTLTVKTHKFQRLSCFFHNSLICFEMLTNLFQS